jgi:uncharacterized protein YndB with AHSA1/START domain
VFALLADAGTWTSWTPFTAVVVERAGGPDGVGEIRRTRSPGAWGRERVIAVEPDTRLSYAYLAGSLAPFMRDYVATVDLEESGGATTIRWQASFQPRFPGLGWPVRLLLGPFLQRCADGLAARAEETTSA